MKFYKILTIISPCNVLMVYDNTTKYQLLYCTTSEDCENCEDFKNYADYEVEYVGATDFNTIKVIIKKKKKRDNIC